MASLPHPPLKRLRDEWSSRSPMLLFAIKSALAAGFSWEIVYALLGVEAAALAVVSAVIVVQVTSWQTVRKSIERILGVIIGVLLAVLVAHFLGLTILTITLMVFFAQIIGMFLQNRGQYLATQIPISAALALVLGATGGDYPLLRMLGALVGGLIGTVISLLLSPPVYVFRARDAVAELMTQLANAIPKLADALAIHLNEAESREIYTQIRKLEQRVHATEQAYSLGIDSARLNPWAHRARRLLIDYPDVLLALDRVVRQMRRIAYTLNEPEPSWAEIVQKQDWALDYAHLLNEIGSILVSAVGFIRSPATTQSNGIPDREELSISMEQAQQQLRIWQEQLAQDAKQIESQDDKADSPSVSMGQRIAIRGAILTDLRRMLDEVYDVVAMVSHPSLSEQVEGLSKNKTRSRLSWIRFKMR
jgi:uncharacterized membrane protein YgaE (UPF0421/DUF939 family)